MGVQFLGLKICYAELLKENQNKIFWTVGQFEFEYLEGSNVMNKLNLSSYYPQGSRHEPGDLEILISCKQEFDWLNVKTFFCHHRN